VIGCPTAPLSGCQGGAKVQIQVNEKTPGKENIKVKIDKLTADTTLALFGDPIGGNTSYAVCLFNEDDVRIATMRVNRAGQQCGTRPCWKATGGPGYKFSDKLLASEGVLQLSLKSGLATKGKVGAKAKNNLPKGILNMPTGVAAQLIGDREATVQIVTSNAGCITGTVTNVRDATDILFKGTTP
jgi:hypothetical protein